MSVFQNTPVGPVSRAFGITAVRAAEAADPAPRNIRRPADPPERNVRRPTDRPGNRPPSRPGTTQPPPPPTTGTAVGAAPGGDYPLAGLLHCAACQLPLRPMELLGGRAYGAPCGCRLTMVAADVLERRVFDAVVAREPVSGGPTREAPDVRHGWADLFRCHLAEVRVGAAPDDLTLVWKI